jgi:hypothetical protein
MFECFSLLFISSLTSSPEFDDTAGKTVDSAETQGKLSKKGSRAEARRQQKEGSYSGRSSSRKEATRASSLPLDPTDFRAAKMMEVRARTSQREYDGLFLAIQKQIENNRENLKFARGMVKDAGIPFDPNNPMWQDILNLQTKGRQLDQKLEDLTTERMEKRQKIIIDVDDPSNSFRTPMQKAPTESIDSTGHSDDLSDLANDGSDVERAFRLDENTSPNLMLGTNDNISPSRPDAAAADALLMLPSHAAPYQSV